MNTPDELLKKHSHDASTHPPVMPANVFFPTSTKEVCAILSQANAQKTPVTVCGAQTSLEGNAIPSEQGIVVDMTHMNRVLSLSAEDFQVTVEPGILGDTLNEYLAAHNLMFPAFPASSHIATIGGMIGNNAGGMYAVKYGVVGDWVMDMEVVLADGRVITVGSRSIKSVAGYNIKQLLIGSEGTLGIVTKATLRVIPYVKARLLAMVSFATVKDALNATLGILHANIDPAAVEFLDSRSIHYVNVQHSLGWQEAPTLLIELHGHTESFTSEVAILESVSRKNNALHIQIAHTKEEQDKIWRGRKAVHPSIMASIPNAGIVPGDIGIPISQIPLFMKHVEETTKKYTVQTATFGHIGDGNFHVWIAYERGNEESLKKAKAAASALVTHALALGGTCTAEHGVGIGKRTYLAQEHADTIPIMKEIKSLFDPNGILNPGKIF